MALTNHERVGKALDLLINGLSPYVEREMKAVYGDAWLSKTQAMVRDHAITRAGSKDVHWDVQALLDVLSGEWEGVFRKKLSRTERTLTHELRDVRNEWAHQRVFSTDDAYRAIDSIHRLLLAVSAPEAPEVEAMKQALLRTRFDEERRKEVRKVSAAPLEGQPQGGLLPWREIVTPHPDVASGNFQQAEFAADLAQVFRGEGSDEYRKPRDFFQRTYLTEGLRLLLVNALKRLTGGGGDPVVELQTSFGGGKTHSQLALFHLVSGVAASELPGIEPVLAEAGVKQPPKARRAVLVGTALSPAEPRRHDGLTVRTLWGELAWQLLGKPGYERVARADEKGVSPGSDILRELLSKAAPCLILVDEWVAYTRQLKDVAALSGGSFEANLTFAQALTEAVRAVPNALLVATIPESDIEVGGEAGREALDRLRNTLGRIQTPWRPATAEESFEIVRRRLFQPIEVSKAPSRDAVTKAFSEYYRANPQEFPKGCGEGEYERRLRAAYPIHPELFDRLYTDWSSLDRFQRTRGVLRLMAQVIRDLWQRGDKSLMILPASVPLDEAVVQSELTRYLEDNWIPVIERDVDGPSSLPLALDKSNNNFGRYSAARRVARSIFMGTAPTLHAANTGMSDRQIKLGCAQPGESVATFGDALRHLADRAMHLYVDGQRYWFSTQQTVARLAQDRAAQRTADDVHQEIARRLQAQAGTRGDFHRAHVCPVSTADVPDEPEARLVILDPQYPHVSNDWNSPAAKEAAATLESRGTTPRRNRNAVVFLAADKARLAELDSATRSYLAWKSIHDDWKSLNLDPFQQNQVQQRLKDQDQTVDARLPGTFQWLLVPEQPEATGPVKWKQIRQQAREPLAARASTKLRDDGDLVVNLGPATLRLELDRVPLWRGDDVSIKQLRGDFGTYLYLPRLKDPEVLRACIEEGPSTTAIMTDGFAYAESWDEAKQRYRGLRFGERASASLEAGLVVKPEVAARQIEAERTKPPSGEFGREATAGGASTGAGQQGTVAPPLAPKALRRFHGSVALDPQRLGRDASRIAEEIVQHLTTLPGATVEISLEIQAVVPEGAPEKTVRTVTENARTLKFRTQGFEEE